VGFFRIGVSGFGGVMPMARWMLVDDRRWMDDQEFTRLLGLAQTVPGPNILNLAIVLGDRHHGVRGALAAGLGLMLAPLAIVLTLAALLEHYRNLEVIRRILPGVSAAAAGLVVAVALRLASRLERKPWMVGLGLLTFLAAVTSRIPLPLILLTLGPVGVVVARLGLRQEP